MGSQLLSCLRPEISHMEPSKVALLGPSISPSKYTHTQKGDHVGPEDGFLT